MGERVRMADFAGGAVDLARDLLGLRLVRIDGRGRRCAGRIVETEAYVGPHDLAAHSANGRRTARNRSMYLPSGHAYVYFVYGLHWCFNVVAQGAAGAEAVLIRALEPLEGLEEMAARRGTAEPRLLCAGPARLTQALAIDRDLDGVDLRRSDEVFIERCERPVGGSQQQEAHVQSRLEPSAQESSGPHGRRRSLVDRPTLEVGGRSVEPLATTRIGVAYAGEWAARPWRFLLPGAAAWWSRPPKRSEPARPA